MKVMLSSCKYAAKDFDVKKNAKNGIYIKDLTSQSNKRVFWKCADCGYSWENVVYARVGTTIQKPIGCQACAKQAREQVKLENMRKNGNGAAGKGPKPKVRRGPAVAKESAADPPPAAAGSRRLPTQHTPSAARVTRAAPPARSSHSGGSPGAGAAGGADEHMCSARPARTTRMGRMLLRSAAAGDASGVAGGTATRATGGSAGSPAGSEPSASRAARMARMAPSGAAGKDEAGGGITGSEPSTADANMAEDSAEHAPGDTAGSEPSTASQGAAAAAVFAAGQGRADIAASGAIVVRAFGASGAPDISLGRLPHAGQHSVAPSTGVEMLAGGVKKKKRGTSRMTKEKPPRSEADTEEFEGDPVEPLGYQSFRPQGAGAGQGGYSKGGVLPGGYAPGGYPPVGYAPGGYIPGGFVPGGYMPGGYVHGGFPPGGYGYPAGGVPQGYVTPPVGGYMVPPFPGGYPGVWVPPNSVPYHPAQGPSQGFWR